MGDKAAPLERVPQGPGGSWGEGAAHGDRVMTSRERGWGGGRLLVRKGPGFVAGAVQ